MRQREPRFPKVQKVARRPNSKNSGKCGLPFGLTWPISHQFRQCVAQSATIRQHFGICLPLSAKAFQSWPDLGHVWPEIAQKSQHTARISRRLNQAPRTRFEQVKGNFGARQVRRGQLSVGVANNCSATVRGNLALSLSSSGPQGPPAPQSPTTEGIVKTACKTRFTKKSLSASRHEASPQVSKTHSADCHDDLGCQVFRASRKTVMDWGGSSRAATEDLIVQTLVKQIVGQAGWIPPCILLSGALMRPGTPSRWPGPCMADPSFSQRCRLHRVRRNRRPEEIGLPTRFCAGAYRQTALRGTRNLPRAGAGESERARAPEKCLSLRSASVLQDRIRLTRAWRIEPPPARGVDLPEFEPPLRCAELRRCPSEPRKGARTACRPRDRPMHFALSPHRPPNPQEGAAPARCLSAWSPPASRS